MLYAKICVPALNANKGALKKFIKNNENSLLTIYAAICMGFPENFKEEQVFYEELDTRMQAQSNSYTRQFHKAIEDSDTPAFNTNFLNYLSIILLVLFALLFSWIFYSRKVLSNRLAAIKAAPLQTNNNNIERLNKQELEIYMLIYLNKSAKEIAQALSLKLGALKQTVNGIYTKLQIKTLMEN